MQNQVQWSNWLSLGKPQEPRSKGRSHGPIRMAGSKSSQSAAANCSISGNCFQMPDGETYGPASAIRHRTPR